MRRFHVYNKWNEDEMGAATARKTNYVSIWQHVGRTADPVNSQRR